jgi:hypothetical protein
MAVPCVIPCVPCCGGGSTATGVCVGPPCQDCCACVFNTQGVFVRVAEVGLAPMGCRRARLRPWPEVGPGPAGEKRG